VPEKPRPCSHRKAILLSRATYRFPVGIHQAVRSSLNLVMINTDRSAQAVPGFPLQLRAPGFGDASQATPHQSFLAAAALRERVSSLCANGPLEGEVPRPGGPGNQAPSEDRNACENTRAIRKLPGRPTINGLRINKILGEGRR